MKRIILSCTILALLFVRSASSQTINDIDHLKAAYLSAESDSGRVAILNQLAQAYENPDSVLYYSHKLLQAATNQPVIWTCRAYHKIGQAYRFKGDLEMAIEYLFKALELAEDLEPRQKAVIFITLGDVYGLANDFLRSGKYQRQAIRIFKNSGTRADSIFLIATYNNLGDKFLSNGVYDSAMSYFQAARPIAEALDQEYFLAVIKGNVGLVKAGLGLDKEAEIEIIEAVTYLSKLKEYYSVAVYLTYMSDIYFNRGEIPKAIHYASEAYSFAVKESLREQIRDASLKLYELYKVAGQFQTALKYHEEFVAYKDSITNRESIQKMADLRTEYEVGQKQAEVDLLTAEKRNQQLVLIATGAFAFVLIILAAIIFRYYQDRSKTAHILTRQKEELERLNQTKDKFFSIISHDLRGPVSSFMGISFMIRHMINSKQPEQLLEVADDIDNSVKRLSSLLDNLLSWAMQQQGSFPYVPEKLNFSELADELVQTLSTMAEGKKIRLQSEISESVVLWADKNTTMTILRNLVSNSLKFTPEGGEVKIRAVSRGEHAEISISDTGVGIPKEKLEKLFSLEARKSTYGTDGEKGLGLGLQLVKEFVDMNQGQIRVSSEEGQGTSFTIRLPLFEAERVGSSFV